MAIKGIITVEFNGTTSDPLGWPIIRGLDPQFEETVYSPIFEVNAARQVKYEQV